MPENFHDELSGGGIMRKTLQKYDTILRSSLASK